MIKAQDATRRVPVQDGNTPNQQGSIDALALALGFHFEDGSYVRAGKKRGLKKGWKKRAAVQKQAPVTRKHKHANLGTVYTALKAGEVGSQVDVTNYGIPLTGLQRRIETYHWYMNNSGTNYRFEPVRIDGRLFIRRIA